MAEALSVPGRARTDEQKLRRRRTILDAADVHLRAAGFEAFSMAELGRLAGVAKGTLYLYFSTREEVLLTLFGEKLEAWVDTLTPALTTRVSDADFVSAFYESAYADPALLPLMSRLDSVIEHNVSVAALIAAKRGMAVSLEQLASAVAPRLDLSLEQTRDALGAMSALLLGVCQVDAGPALEAQPLPDDVRQFTDGFSSRTLFHTNARRILIGIRIESQEASDD